MSAKSKFFRVAVEGATTDGRIIERSWIQDMAATYKPATYGARINMEHIRGFSDQPPFNAYGNVLAAKAEEVEIELGGKTEKRLALFVEIAPNEQLIKANRAGQKVYTSIEVNPNFAGTGKAYLMGLAITDNPASLGTEMLEFVAKTPAIKAEFDKRKQGPENLFTAAFETMFELEGDAASAGDGTPGLFAAMTTFFNRFGQGAAPADAAASAAAAGAAPATPPAVGGASSFSDPALQLAMMTMAQGFDASLQAVTTRFTTELGKVREEFGALSTKLSTTENLSGARPAAAGGAGAVLTDC